MAGARGVLRRRGTGGGGAGARANRPGGGERRGTRHHWNGQIGFAIKSLWLDSLPGARDTRLLSRPAALLRLAVPWRGSGGDSTRAPVRRNVRDGESPWDCGESRDSREQVRRGVTQVTGLPANFSAVCTAVTSQTIPQLARTGTFG